MERKSVTPKDLEVGQRYMHLGSGNTIDNWFFVEDVTDGRIYITYTDGLSGLLYSNSEQQFLEIPVTSLEKELE